MPTDEPSRCAKFFQRYASADALRDVLLQAGVLEERELAAILQDRQVSTALELGNLLIGRGLLTAFQLRAIEHGKTRGIRLGHYIVLDKVGEGGMGHVYKARHFRMNRVVALKILSRKHMRNPQKIQRFFQEVEAAARLTHPNIVTAYDAGESEGLHFLVMELIDGPDLAKLVKEQGPLSPSQAIDVIKQAATGLAYAHEQGLVHRDIKPDNILLDQRGVVRILDLGIARIVDSAEDDVETASPETGILGATSRRNLTVEGSIMGTASFMSPEQSVDSKQVDRRGDIYSLGCTLYYLLSGSPPFQEKSVQDIVMAHRQEPAPDIRNFRSDVSQGIADIMQKCMAKSPSDRFQNAEELLAALSSLDASGEEALIVAEPVAAANVTARRASFGRRWGYGLAGGLIVFLLLASTALLNRGYFAQADSTAKRSDAHWQAINKAEPQGGTASPSIERDGFPLEKFQPDQLSADGHGLVAAFSRDPEMLTRVATRVDKNIDFLWMKGVLPPAGQKIYAPYYARWKGWLKTPSGGDYDFCIVSNGGVRIWIDDALVLDKWEEHRLNEGESRFYGSPIDRYEFVTTFADQPQEIRVEYNQTTPAPSCLSLMVRDAKGRLHAVPASWLFVGEKMAAEANVPAMSDSNLTSENGLHVEYYRGSGFDQLVATSETPGINEFWCKEAPRPELNPDNFSVRWVGWLMPPVDGNYELDLIGGNSLSLMMDETSIFSDPGTEPQIPISYRKTTIQELKRRPYRIQVAIAETAGSNVASLRWVVPGTNEAVPIPPECFFLEWPGVR
ncbi:protein kinase [Blastopirellula sp. JC732]|uniref:non-specific serine/threonine protein kinase n=1 Tax=Blastopirellula sediminis TaxID=2894196 RepID=A0A9X1SEU8_9BACT|nr:protein kinase [Blastopirellula sediminis]MCC9604416.1 protein kinase [Blastopirellula sediminis]MCC9626936.1 protein kinase [Blastopirellula sediminis]